MVESDRVFQRQTLDWFTWLSESIDPAKLKKLWLLVSFGHWFTGKEPLKLTD